MFHVIDSRTKVVIIKAKDHYEAQDKLVQYLGDHYAEFIKYFEIIEGASE